MRRGAKSAASRLVNRLELDVPVRLRVVERAVARSEASSRTDPEGDAEPAAEVAVEEGESIESLKQAALARLRAKD